ncbi:AAA family ATPase [Microbacterium testaceum]|uniref:AAA family ATPase n=1 Tax=Microbacterium testaceum TaxID=2033 RepID=UPI002AC728A4|nr:AAA family ATPase [Microbacterium testaceum]MDZ5144154.1 AAA family ATPase [Microbacterium testaceum]
MTLNEDLASWLDARPDWQKDAVSRFCRNEALSTEDVAEIADKLIAGTYPTAASVDVADIPGSTAAGDSVALVQVADVQGVNALIGGQTLSFGSAGMTIAFGNNASGKSGYARLIREAVTARVKAEHLLGDVFADDETSQAAKLEYLVGANPKTWNLGESQSTELSRVRFYDEECGDAYVTAASEVNYRPSALTILDQLSDACEAVAAELTRRLGANQTERPPLPVLHPGTSASSFLSGLSAATSLDAIASATTLADDHDEQLAKYLAEEARLKGSDPNKEKARLEALSREWVTVQRHAEIAAEALGSGPLGDLKDQRKKAAELREAARIASVNTFDSEPLASVGSETWRALWKAAREFSLSDAYHEHDYPFTEDGAVCVLCQQPLSEQAADRLSRFEAFVTDTTSRDADLASTALAARRGALAELQTLPITVTTAVNRLRDGGEEVQPTLDWLEGATRVAQTAVAWLDGPESHDLQPLTDTISAPAAARARALTAQASDIDASTFAQTLGATSRQVVELQDTKTLSEAKTAIDTEVARLAQRKKIEDVRRLTATNALTTKRGELTETYVTQEVRDRFTRETERLELRRVTLNRTGRGRSSALAHQPSLLGSRRNAGIEEVLSEGEQTALGLAGFLTEVELDASLSSVVLDDPVSSLDAGRRSKVAQRLVELSSQRQVIVFTHEITFVHALNQEAKRRSVPVTLRSIQRMGGVQPGLVADQLPWAVRDIPQRINKLEADLANLGRERANLTEDDYAERTGQIAGRLSETLERAVHLHIVNELVDRGSNVTQPTMLKILPKFTQADHDEFQAAYSKTSSWAARHDNAPEENYVPPTVEEISQEVAWFKGWHDRIKRYRN